MSDTIDWFVSVMVITLGLVFALAVIGCDKYYKESRDLRIKAVELNHAKWVITDTTRGTVEWVWATNRTEIGK